MTSRQQKALQRYVDAIKPDLGLSDWELLVRLDPPPDVSHLASHKSVPGVRTSLIRCADAFFDLSAEAQREILVHELLHAVFAPTQDQVRHILPEHLKGRAGQVFIDFWFQSHEYAIDQLATAFNKHFPLPELP